MAEQITDNRALVPKDDAEKFKGYTLSELRYQRALVALQREFAKEKAFQGLGRLKKLNPFSGRSNSKAASGIHKATSIIATIASKMSYLDYATLGFSLFKSGKKIFNFIRRKK